jgi:hypothetical protein
VFRETTGKQPVSDTYNQHGAKTMNKFESRQPQLKLDTDEGWMVQVYGSNRRLLCALEPSHGWIFLIGGKGHVCIKKMRSQFTLTSSGYRQT